MNNNFVIRTPLSYMLRKRFVGEDTVNLILIDSCCMCKHIRVYLYAGLMELVDSFDLGSKAVRRAGSSPVSGTMR